MNSKEEIAKTFEEVKKIIEEIKESNDESFANSKWNPLVKHLFYLRECNKDEYYKNYENGVKEYADSLELVKSLEEKYPSFVDYVLKFIHER